MVGRLGGAELRSDADHPGAARSGVSTNCSGWPG